MRKKKQAEKGLGHQKSDLVLSPQAVRFVFRLFALSHVSYIVVCVGFSQFALSTPLFLLSLHDLITLMSSSYGSPSSLVS